MDYLRVTLLALAAVGLIIYYKRRWRRVQSFSSPDYHPVLDTSILAIASMDIPAASEYQGNISTRETAMARLSTSLNDQLQRLFEHDRPLGREHLASALVEAVEYLVMERLNSAGYSLGGVDYGGDINFENSDQTYSNGTEMNTGLILEFHGFSCKVSWSEQS